MGVSLLFTRELAAGSAPPAKQGKQEDRGFTLYESFDGSSNTDGQVTDFTSTAGYIFNKHSSVDMGSPDLFCPRDLLHFQRHQNDDDQQWHWRCLQQSAADVRQSPGELRLDAALHKR